MDAAAASFRREHRMNHNHPIISVAMQDYCRNQTIPLRTRVAREMAGLATVIVRRGGANQFPGGNCTR
jgi:hypothetical protein